MYFVFVWEQKATCATYEYSMNWLAFITEMKSVYSAVRTGPLHVKRSALRLLKVKRLIWKLKPCEVIQPDLQFTWHRFYFLNSKKFRISLYGLQSLSRPFLAANSNCCVHAQRQLPESALKSLLFVTVRTPYFSQHTNHLLAEKSVLNASKHRLPFFHSPLKHFQLRRFVITGVPPYSRVSRYKTYRG
jgi:hypothetical protein